MKVPPILRRWPVSSSVTVTARYADLVDDAAAHAAEKVGDVLAKAMNEEVERCGSLCGYLS